MTTSAIDRLRLPYLVECSVEHRPALVALAAVLSRALGSKVGFLFQPPPKSGVGIRDMRICFSVVVFEARDSFRIQWVVQLGNVFSCPGSHGRVGLISIQT